MDAQYFIKKTAKWQRHIFSK